ncbi:MAG: hypothetical protein JNL42_05755 [Anaerolineae bacterium]|nr:hypothetical protein [Anaerolineae bacterium]
MKRTPLSISLHGLRAQVLLWTVLPVTLLTIMFSLSGIQSHQNSMRALAVEENTRLVFAYARVIALEVENHRLNEGAASPDEALASLPLDQLLTVDHPAAVTSFVLLDQDGRILFSRGEVPDQQHIHDWHGVQEALSRTPGHVFASDTEHGDVIAYAPVQNTPWVLLIREPWHAITDPLIRFEQVMPFILVTAVTTSLLILFFGLRYLVRPLQELGLRISRFGQDDFSALNTHLGGVKEIEDLRTALSDMANRVKTYQSALQNYLGAITRAQEQERVRLSRELHDETVQTLIALGHKAQMAQRSYQRQSPQTDTYLQDLRQMIAQAIEEVRRFSQALRPIYLEELGLLAALESLAREAKSDLHVRGRPVRLDAERENILYRVAQEGLNNALRHAHAERIQLCVAFGDEAVTLRIIDDGVGFVVPANYAVFTQQGHFGMMGMHERALQADAQVQVISAPGKGTELTLTMPLRAR